MKTCYFCKGNLELKKTSHVHRWKGQIFLFENLLAEICDNCGEVYLLPQSLKKIDQTVQSKQPPLRHLSVPVYSFS
jgi:YgiT-type zinc finger domain-containing protein